jgi:hypothetical protein
MLDLDPDRELDLVYGLAEPFEPGVETGLLSVSAPRLLQAAKGQAAGAHRLRMRDGLGSGLPMALLVQPAAVPSRWDTPAPVLSVDVLCSSTLVVVRRSRACDPFHGSADAQEARSLAHYLEGARNSASGPVAMAPGEEDSTVQLCPCPDIPAVGRGDCCPVAQSASMVSVQAAAVVVTVRALSDSDGSAGSHRPGFSAQLRRSVRSELASWSRWRFLQCRLRQSELRFRRRAEG